MLVNNIRRNITETERDQVIAEFAQRLANTGPFTLHFVAADARRTPTEVLKNAGLDNAYSSRLIVLDPAQFTLRDSTEGATLTAISLAMGLDKGVEQLPVQWASSAVYAVSNAQRRAFARKVAVEYIACEKALSAPEVQNDAELKGRGTKDLTQAKEQLQKAIRRAYQHVVYLAQPDPAGERRLSEVTFDDDHSSALDGTIVWKALAEREKVFDAGQFDAKALVHNLREGDYGKTLSDIRRSFYSAPRMPLLHGGDGDLQQAIYDAVMQGILDVVDGSGITVEVTAPNQINLASTGLRLVKPQARPVLTADSQRTWESVSKRASRGLARRRATEPRKSPGTRAETGRATAHRPSLRRSESGSPSRATCWSTRRMRTSSLPYSGDSTLRSTRGTSTICKPICSYSPTPPQPKRYANSWRSCRSRLPSKTRGPLEMLEC